MSIDSLKRRIKYKPIVLVILDGWGISPSWGGNAIAMSNPPAFNSLWRNYPHTILQAFRPVAGSFGKVGSSEIGHASIGSGRIVSQDSIEINNTIKSGQFFQNKVLLEACEFVKKNRSRLHFIGLLSDGSIHSHIDHLFALLKLAKEENVSEVLVHVITDGRDAEENSALLFVDLLEKYMQEMQIGQIASVVGRYYAMDRDDNLDRTAAAYELQTQGKGNVVSSAKEAIKRTYKEGLTDEYLPPFIIRSKIKDQRSKIAEKAPIVQNKDAVVFFNFRSDRARQLTRFYTDKKYLRKMIFWRKYQLLDILFITLTSYYLSSLPLKIAFSPAVIDSCLARILSDHGLSQLHVAESEKYAHVSYFFNGGREEPFVDEDREIIPSLKSKNYKNTPEMSAEKITDSLIKAIKSKKYDFILANYANVDMVGHTGDMEATSKAISCVDKEISKLTKTILENKGALVITADHGNAEQMANLKKIDTETMHTLNPVPFIIVTPHNKKNLISSAISPTKGILDEIVTTERSIADIAPTILELIDIAKPSEMTGESLLRYLK